MKAKLVALAAVNAAILALGTSAWSQTTVFDGNVTPGGDLTFGTGNLNGGFKVVTDASGALQLGLRGKLDHQNVFPDNGNGIYVVPEGAGISSTRASWNYEFSINVNANGSAPAATLGNYTFLLLIDSDPSAGTSFTSFNPVTLIGDNTPIGSTTLAQNSENALFPVVGVPGYNPNNPGLYDIVLEVLNTDSRVIASDTIQIDVVPEVSYTLPLLGAAVLGLAFMGRKVKATA